MIVRSNFVDGSDCLDGVLEGGSTFLLLVTHQNGGQPSIKPTALEGPMSRISFPVSYTDEVPL